MLTVSILTPSFNQGQFIERTLQSVIDQKTQGVVIEHFVIDGGSKDETIEILRRYGDLVRWISEKDEGQTAAINKGISGSSGEIIGWLNSDDIYYPGAIQRAVDYFMSHPEVDVIYGRADHIDLDDKAFEEYPTEPWSLERLKERCFICQPALFFRRRVVGRHGFLDETLNYCMDYEYWLRLGDGDCCFVFINEKFAGSRLYPDNKTLGARVQVHKEINCMLKQKLGKVPDRWLLNYAHAVTEEKINRSIAPRWFLIKLLFTAFFASLKWNYSLSRSLRAILVGWLMNAKRV